MRYALVRVKGDAPKELPVGMNDILGMGEYQKHSTARRYLAPSPEYREKLRGMGYTTLALYEVPRSYALPSRLVLSYEV